MLRTGGSSFTVFTPIVPTLSRRRILGRSMTKAASKKAVRLAAGFSKLFDELQKDWTAIVIVLRKLP